MLTGTDSAPVKANEAAQKNDIGAAKDQIYLDVQDAQTDAYINVYVVPGTAKGSASTSVGQKVIGKIVEKYGTAKKVGKASIKAKQESTESDGTVRIWTTDFEVEGTISRQGGALSWGEILINTLGAEEDPDTPVEIVGNTITLNKEQNFGVLKNSTKYHLPSDTNIIVTKPIDVTENGITTTKEQQIVIPAGFIVSSESGDTLETGMVIKHNTDGNEFVWVPVEQPLTFSDGTVGTIALGRYTFGSKESPSISEPQSESTNIKLSVNSYIAQEKDTDGSVSNFKNKSKASKGYYIGRYEMGIEGATYENNSWTETSTNSKKVVCQSGKKAYNGINRTNALSESKNLYNEELYTSDMTNSLAWDTAIVYIIKCEGINSYAYEEGKQGGGSTTTDIDSLDEHCKIINMAKGNIEWSTETSNCNPWICVFRGGNWNASYDYTSSRDSDTDTTSSSIGFRPIIYISNLEN